MNVLGEMALPFFRFRVPLTYTLVVVRQFMQLTQQSITSTHQLYEANLFAIVTSLERKTKDFTAAANRASLKMYLLL